MSKTQVSLPRQNLRTSSQPTHTDLVKGNLCKCTTAQTALLHTDPPKGTYPGAWLLSFHWVRTLCSMGWERNRITLGPISAGQFTTVLETTTDVTSWHATPSPNTHWCCLMASWPLWTLVWLTNQVSASLKFLTSTFPKFLTTKSKGGNAPPPQTTPGSEGGEALSGGNPCMGWPHVSGNSSTKPKIQTCPPILYVPVPIHQFYTNPRRSAAAPWNNPLPPPFAYAINTNSHLKNVAALVLFAMWQESCMWVTWNGRGWGLIPYMSAQLLDLGWGEWPETAKAFVAGLKGVPRRSSSVIHFLWEYITGGADVTATKGMLGVQESCRKHCLIMLRTPLGCHLRHQLAESRAGLNCTSNGVDEQHNAPILTFLSER